MNRPLALLLLSLVAFRPAVADQSIVQRFASVSELRRSVAREEGDALVGKWIEVEGWFVADFWRDAYLVDGAPAPGSGLRVSTDEHMAEVGERVRWRGVLKLEKGELFLDAGRGGAVESLPGAYAETRRSEPAPLDLVAAPEDWEGQLLLLPELEVVRLLRDASDVPWLLIGNAGGAEVAVHLSDGLHPVLVEGARFSGLRGIWQRDGERWRLRPRGLDDFLLGYEGERRGDPPSRRPLRQAAGRLETKPGGSAAAPLVGRARAARLMLDEVCYDPGGPGDGEGAESFAVVNAGDRPQPLDGWTVTDTEGVWNFPAGLRLRPGRKLHVARNYERFYFEFGFPPEISFDGQPSPGDGALILDNAGDELVLLDERGRVADAFVFENGYALEQSGWNGPSARPFRFGAYIPDEGQVFWRKRDLASGGRLDTDSASDWLCDPDDPSLGRQLSYPGWDREPFWDTARCRERAEVTAFVSPDNSFAGMLEYLRSARSSIEIEIYLFTHPEIADELIAAMERGVRVQMLLDGEVFGSRGGTYESVRAIARRITTHPSGLGQVYLWRNGDDPRHTGMDADIPDRYNHCHQKFIIVDRERVLIGSDNLTQSSLPADDMADGTSGSRGAFLITDASCVVERVIAVWEADCDPERQRDVRLYVTRAGLEEQDPQPGGNRAGYAPVQPAVFTAVATAGFELSQSPDNALRPDRGYLGLANRAGEGDWLLVEQQYERPYWGGGERADNPRLVAYADAARRGASVRVLLSGAGGTSRNLQSWRAAERMNRLAEEEGLDLQVALGAMPDGRPGRESPIHNKMLLARVGGEYWSHVGSANGSETAHRFNREIGLSIESEALFDYFAKVFRADWLLVDGEAKPLPDAWRVAKERR